MKIAVFLDVVTMKIAVFLDVVPQCQIPEK
jgi:hypothetical protein